jgi:septum formation protein
LLGVEFTVAVPDVDETPLPGERPVDYVRRLALEKAAAVPGGRVLAADTCVALGGEIVGKPEGADDARRMLAALSGRSHRVHTGVALRRNGSTRVEVCTTLVTLAVLSAPQIDAYVATGEPLDKAGAYAIQGAAAAFVPFIRGSASNVVGLPMHLVAEMLRGIS